jgi:hypothetical protein
VAWLDDFVYLKTGRLTTGLLENAKKCEKKLKFLGRPPIILSNSCEV